MENPIVISILIGFGAMALVIGGFMFLKEYLGNRNIDQKLDRFTGKGGGGGVSEITQGSILREALDNGNAKGLFDQIIQQLPNAQKMIEQADIKMSVQQFYGITAILAWWAWLFDGGSYAHAGRTCVGDYLGFSADVLCHVGSRCSL